MCASYPFLASRDSTGGDKLTSWVATGRTIKPSDRLNGYPLIYHSRPPLIVCRRIGFNEILVRDAMGPDRVKCAFGRALRRRREALGISQEELAHRAGLHRTYVGDVERGERNVSLLNIVKLASALGTAPSELFQGWDA